MNFDITQEYQWGAFLPTSVTSVNISAVINEINSIERVHGKVTPELLVESSRNKESVLHPYFEWNNKVAGEKWRNHQASLLLRNIQVKVIKDGEPKFIRAYEVVNRGGGSKPGISISVGNLSDADKKRILMSLTSDLRKITKRINDMSDDSDAIPYLNMAIEVLEKEFSVTEQAATLSVVAE